jgi:lipid-binding SYLF domain-containing protein
VTADLVSFTRSKGVYGGVNLDGTVVHANTKFNGEFFGAKKEVLPPNIVMRHTYKSASATPLLNAVAKVAGK